MGVPRDLPELVKDLGGRKCCELQSEEQVEVI